MTGQNPVGRKPMLHRWISMAGWAKRDVLRPVVHGGISWQNTSTVNAQIAAANGTTTLLPDYIPNDLPVGVIHFRFHITGAIFAGQYTFTVSSANATAGATYTNNSVTFTVLTTISGLTTLSCSGASAPAASGTLTKTAGTGDSTITFSAFATASLLTLQYSDGTVIAVVNLVTAFPTLGAAAPSAAGSVVTATSTGVTLWTGYDPTNAPLGKGIQAVMAGVQLGSAINVVLDTHGAF